jgi:tight adherence protein C
MTVFTLAILGTEASVQNSLLAIGFILSSAVLASTTLSLLLQRKESPHRRMQRRLQMLKSATAGSAGIKSDLGNKKGSNPSCTNSSCTQDKASLTKESISVSLTRFLAKLTALPVIRIGAKPIAVRLEQQRVQALRDSCMIDLPEMVDILSLALGAGLSIDQAFEWYLSSYDTPLAGEFRRAEQAYQVGMLSRMKAFEELAESLQEEAVLRFVNALRQAFALGSPLGPALDTLSQDVRKYRVARIEERIAKTPVKILAPLGLCIVPAVLILLMGPIMSQVMQGLQL